MLHHRDLIEMDDAECWELLRNAPLARIGFDAGDRVDVLPVNHVVYDGTVAWLSAPGAKLAVAAREHQVTVEVDDVNPETRTGWSVVVHGTARIVSDPVREEDLYGVGTIPWTESDRRVLWIELADPVISGRRVSG